MTRDDPKAELMIEYDKCEGCDCEFGDMIEGWCTNCAPRLYQGGSVPPPLLSPTRDEQLEQVRRDVAASWDDPQAQTFAILLLDIAESLRPYRCLDCGADKPSPQDTRPAADDLLYDAWTLIANVGEGDWTKQSAEWQLAALRWRDAWHTARSLRPVTASGHSSAGEVMS